MVRLQPAPLPPVALDFGSVVLATIGLALFFLPVLGVPIAAIGLVLGVAALLGCIWCKHLSLRWSLLGIAASVLALVVDVGIAYAPTSFIQQRQASQSWESAPDRPYVPPPAQAGWWHRSR